MTGSTENSPSRRPVLRKLRERLRRGFSIPFLDLHIGLLLSRKPIIANDQPSLAILVSTNETPENRVDLVALQIMVGHIQAVVKKYPELQTLHIPQFDSTAETASAFLDFLNDAVVLYEDNAKGVHLRRQLVRLRGRLKDKDLISFVDRNIAISDFGDGVIERALSLITDGDYSRAVAQERDAFDNEYEATPPFLSVLRDALDFSVDVRGNSLLWHLQLNPQLFAGKRVLHIAPEAAVERFFRAEKQATVCEYETLDGFSTSVDHIQDITDLQFDDATFHLVLCHRVLEHVVDDTAAMSSIFRILAPGGVLDISVPQSMNMAASNEWIAQDSSHHDHVRQYGRDFVERLQSVGFNVAVDRQLLERSAAEHRSDGTYPMRHYLCHKPSQSASADGGALQL